MDVFDLTRRLVEDYKELHAQLHQDQRPRWLRR